MNRTIISLILLLMLSLAPVCSADVISIAGVTVAGGARKGGIPVRLANAESSGQILDADTSSDKGVFTLTDKGVQPSVKGVWIIDGGGSWRSRPVYVELGPASGGVRRAKVDDIVFINFEQQAFTPDDAASLLAAIQETAEIERKVGLRSEYDAKLDIADESTRILAKVPGLEPGSTTAEKVTQDAMIRLDRRILGKPFFEANQLKELTTRKEFLRLRKFNMGTFDLDGVGAERKLFTFLPPL